MPQMPKDEANLPHLLSNSSADNDTAHEHDDDSHHISNLQLPASNESRTHAHTSGHWSTLGYRYGLEDMWDEAADAYERALALDPKDAATWRRYGTALLHTHHPKKALNAYRHALVIEPTNVQAQSGKREAIVQIWHRRGDILRKLKQFAKAIDAYDHVLALEPTIWSAWYSKGLCLRALHRDIEALDVFDHLLENKHDWPEAWSSRGVVLGHLHRYQEALESFDRAIAMSPVYGRAWRNKAKVLRILGRTEEATRATNRADRMPDSANEVRF